MRTLVITCVLLLTAATAAVAQMRTQRWLEIRPTAGAMLPTGDQRDMFDDAASFALQTAWAQSRNLHIVGSFAWIPTNHKFTGVSDPDVNLFQYDVGAEISMVRPMGERWDFRPFVGAGIGGRTYDYDAASLERKTSLAGYGTLGLEFQRGVAALRLEARDYLYQFKDPIQNENFTRNDVGLAVGVAYHIGRHR
jgi:hypothetical protein